MKNSFWVFAATAIWLLAFITVVAAIPDDLQIGSWRIEMQITQEGADPAYSMTSISEGHLGGLQLGCENSGKISLRVFLYEDSVPVDNSIIDVLVNGQILHLKAVESNDSLGWSAEAELSNDEALTIAAADEPDIGVQHYISIRAPGIRMKSGTGLNFAVRDTSLAFQSLMAACEATKDGH